MQSDVNKRRAARQKKARRRRIKIAFILFLVIALITLVIMCFTVFFPIKRINVSGSNIYSKAQIIKASGLTTKDNLFVISEDDIEEKLRKKLPYIDEIKFKRTFPDAVIITVKDAEEYAYYICDGSYYVVSGNGYILKQQQQMPENVFEIVTSGITGNVGEKAQYKNTLEDKMVNTLITELNNKEINIDKIDVSNILEIEVAVEGRFTVVLGSNEYLEEKIAHLYSMMQNISDRGGKINLSMWSPTNSQGTFVEENN